jgi:hypothetical protein
MKGASVRLASRDGRDAATNPINSNNYMVCHKLLSNDLNHSTRGLVGAE